MKRSKSAYTFHLKESSCREYIKADIKQYERMVDIMMELPEDKTPMTKEKFMEYVEANFTLDKRTCLDLLENIFDYAEKHNHTKYNYMLEDLIGDVLDLSDNERKMLCKVE